jgi:predicted dehydrogenase
MATTAAEADHLIALALEHDVRLVASPGEMLFPHNRRIRRLVLEGALGTLAWAITGSTGAGFYHLSEEFRTGEDVLTNVDPTWYFKQPGGGPMYDVTVYCLHAITGILGPARRVTALSSIVLPEMSWRDGPIVCDADDTTMLLLDFGDALPGIVYAGVAGRLVEFRTVSIYGTAGAIVGTRFGDRELKLPGDHEPHVLGAHAGMLESHVFEDIMQLVDAVRDGTPAIASAEHARHVIDIIEAGYRAAETGQAQELRTTFDPLPLEALE